MYKNGINMGQVKKQNRNSILRYMNSHVDVSRKDIAEATGLTAAAVTQICGEFLDAGLIKECGTSADNKGAGRKKVKLRINYEYAYILGITIESANTVIVLSNMKGDLVDRIECNTKMNPTQFVEEIVSKSNDIINKNPSKAKKIKGGCVAIAGPVDKEECVSLHAYGIWNEEVKICNMLEKALKIPFIIENNVDAFSIAELLYGVGSQYENIMVIKWGPGVGCTIVADNKIYEGRHGRSAELGHFIVEKNGKECSCGRKGCLETKISYNAMNEKYAFSIEDFGSVYKHFLDEIDLFARSLVNSMSILAPNRVVLSGKLFADENVRKEFIECCKNYDLQYDEKRILYSPLADEEDYIGSIATFVDRLIF